MYSLSTYNLSYQYTTFNLKAKITINNTLKQIGVKYLAKFNISRTNFKINNACLLYEKKPMPVRLKIGNNKMIFFY